MTRQHAMMWVAASTLGVAAIISAQQPQQGTTTQQPQQQDQQSQQQGQSQQILVHGESDVVDAELMNLQGENLGSLDSLVVDLRNNQVTYAIVSFGGFLGVGDTLHAVPWRAFQFRPLYEGIVLDVTREQIESLEGFTRDDLPDFEDPRWQATTNEQFVQSQQSQQQQQQQERPGTMPDDQYDPDQPVQERTRMSVTTDDLIGIAVENQQGEELGSVRDFAMDLYSGEIVHGVLAYGGWLGMGESMTAVPWTAFTPERIETDNARMLLAMTRQQLEQADEYTLEAWPDPQAGQWAQQFTQGTPGQQEQQSPLQQQNQQQRRPE